MTVYPDTVFFLNKVYTVSMEQMVDPLDRSMGYTLDFSVVWDNLSLFFSGALVTVRLSLIAIAFEIMGALCRTSGKRLLTKLAAIYSSGTFY